MRPRAKLCFYITWAIMAMPYAGHAETSKTNGFGPALRYLAAPIEHYCETERVSTERGEQKDKSVGRGSRRPKNPSPFFTAELLNVSFDISDDSCGEQCRKALAQATIQSLALWRSGCGRCRSGNLLGISINGGLWLDTVTIDKWLFGLRANVESNPQDPKRQQRVSLRPLGLQPVADFRRVDPLRDGQLCAAAKRYAGSSSLETAVCRGSIESCQEPGCLTLPLRVGHGKECDLADRIACGAPDGEVALNTKRYNFRHSLRRLVGSKQVHFGSGRDSVELFPVMLHEIGHWYGLDHAVRNGIPQVSIMRNSYSETKPWCVPEWNLVQVDNAVDLSWDYRLGGMHGLVFEDDDE